MSTPRQRQPVRLEIDADAISANTKALDAATAADLLAVVKGDGYGHGAENLARAAVRGGARWIGVTDIHEGVRLREAGIGVPILSWQNAASIHVAAAEAENIDVAVGSFDDLADVARSGRGLRVHVSVDTGLAREGFPEPDWPRAADLLAAAEKRRRIQVVGLMSHLAAAEAPGHPANRLQRAAFDRALAVLRSAGLTPTILHLAATAATLTAPESHGTLTRVGAGLVGIDLSGSTVRSGSPAHKSTALRGAMTLTAPLLDVREAPAGSPSGYGHLWTADRDTRLGLVPVGYADGLPRRATGRAEVLVRGRRVPVVGALSMNALVVDLGPLGPETAGDRVTVFGTADGAPTVTEWARWADTLPQEIVTAVGRALPRTVVAAAVARDFHRYERKSA